MNLDERPLMTRIASKRLVGPVLSALAMLMAAPAVMASEGDSRHTLGSARDVGRIELRNMDQFEVMGVSDSDAVDELHLLKVRLGTRFDLGSDREQFDTFEERSISLYNQTLGQLGNSAYVTIRKGDLLGFRGRRVGPDDRFLWAHSKEYFPSTIRGAAPTLRSKISIQIIARDLDCAGTRVCGRGDTKVYNLSFDFPKLRGTPPTSCDAAFTYKIGRLDAGLALFSPDGAVAELINTSIPGGGPAIRPINGEICITSTKL